MRRLTVVCLETHEIARRGLGEMLANAAGVELLGMAPDVAAASRLCRSQDRRPDVLILDTGFRPAETEELLALRQAGTAVVILLHSDEPGHLAAVLRLEADGYLLVSELTFEGLEKAIEQVARQQVPMSAAVARFLLERSRAGSAPTTSTNLTRREQEVAALLLEGLSNRVIGRTLGISEHGAKRHVGNILVKLGCANRTSAVARLLTEPMLLQAQ